MMLAKNRGQATTELALSSLVLVSMITAGVYFGEVTFGALKVTEAASSALWDTTHYKHHTMGLTYSNSPLNTAVSQAQTFTNTDYQDFDGRTSPWGTHSANITQVFTRTTGMNVTCGRGSGPAFTPNIFVTPVYTSNSGVWCDAGADFMTVNMPRQLADGAGSSNFFKAQNWTRNTLRMCASGKNKGANCPGRFGLVIDDWGLTGPSGGEWLPAPGIPWGIPPPNISYWWSAYKGFLTSYWINAAFKPVMFTLPASMLAMAVAFMHPMGGIGTYGGVPWNESTFYLSFTGSVLQFQQPLFVGEGNPIWETTPYPLSMMVTYLTSFLRRMGNGGCYLGKRCT